MNKTTTHYSPITVYFRGDEVTFAGRTCICSPPAMINMCIGRHPNDPKYWRIKPMTTDEKLAEIHLLRCRNMHDHELIQPILRPIEWDEDFLLAVKKEILTRQSN